MSDQRQDRSTREGSEPRNSGRRRSPTNWAPIVAITVVAAVGTALASAEPTGQGFFDIIERAAFGAVVTVFATCSRRWTWLILAGAATILSGSVAALLCGLVALGFAVHAAWRTRHRDRLTGALIGALSAQALLRTADVGFFGFTAILTGVVVLFVLVSGYRTMRRRSRRQINRAIGILATFVVLAIGISAYFAVNAAQPLEDGISSARSGLNQASKANQATAGTYWRSAEKSFSKAEQKLSNPLAKIAYAIPVVSQHARLVTTAAASGREVTKNAAQAATVAPYQEIRTSDGTFDLERISSMEQPVEDTVASMTAARDDVGATSNGWIVGPLRERVDDYSDRLVRAVPQAERVLGAIQIAPEVLGGNGPRSYLLLFANPAESRGLGGFIGAWAQLDAVDGKLELDRHGKMLELNEASDPDSREITGEEEYMTRHGHLQPERYLQNVSASADFPTVARVAEQLYPQAGGQEIDGVMYVDPFALEALLKLTGPVTVEGIPEPLTDKNTADFLMHDQYTDLPDINDRTDRLSDVAEATFDALTTRELPTISNITYTLSPMMHQRRLMAYVNDPKANEYFADIGLTGEFPMANGDDLLSVRLSNGSANKADFFLRQEYKYAVSHDEATGATQGTVTGLLFNSAPSSGESQYVLGNRDTRAGRSDGRPFGSITLQFSIYSPLRPVGLEIDGDDVGIQVEKEFGLWVATQTVTIDPGDDASFELRLEGDLEPGRPYTLTVAPQPVAHRQNTRIRVSEEGVRGVQKFESDGRDVETFQASSP